MFTTTGTLALVGDGTILGFGTDGVVASDGAGTTLGDGTAGDGPVDGAHLTGAVASDGAVVLVGEAASDGAVASDGTNPFLTIITEVTHSTEVEGDIPVLLFQEHHYVEGPIWHLEQVEPLLDTELIADVLMQAEVLQQEGVQDLIKVEQPQEGA